MKIKRKILSVLLMAAMVFLCIPGMSYANEETSDIEGYLLNESLRTENDEIRNEELQTESVQPATSNDAVNNAKTGVLKISLALKNGESEYEIQAGTGFLINKTTILTDYHVVYINNSTINYMREDAVIGPIVQGKTDEQIRGMIKITVINDQGNCVEAELDDNSSKIDYDFAVLKLKKTIDGSSSLHIRDSGQVKTNDKCYVLGYTSQDGSVSFTEGKLNEKMNSSLYGVVLLCISGVAPDGFSGGPVIDNSGNVIGMTFMCDYTQTYALASECLIPLLDEASIEYNSKSEDSSKDSKEAKITDETNAVSTQKSALANVNVIKAKSVKAKKVGRKISIKWKKLTKKQRAGVSKIEVQYSTSKMFTAGETRTVRVKKTKGSYTTKKLTKKTYYIRVRNIRNVDGVWYASAWSKTKKVKIK